MSDPFKCFTCGVWCEDWETLERHLRETHPVVKRTISLDFDGVLHAYTRGWHDGTIYDPPISGSIEAVQRLAEDFNLVISTCREDKVAISGWVSRHYGLDIPVTNDKPTAAIYVDDRGMHFEGDWESTLWSIYSRIGKEGQRAA